MYQWDYIPQSMRVATARIAPGEGTGCLRKKEVLVMSTKTALNLGGMVTSHVMDKLLLSVQWSNLQRLGQRVIDRMPENCLLASRNPRQIPLTNV